MGILATWARLGTPADAVTGTTTVGSARVDVPPRFEAVAERLEAGDDARPACAQVGRELARDGADLGEALDGLRDTWTRVRGGDPDFGAVRALSEAWGEETLGYVHQLSCENPLTGLATLAHAQARLEELYRGAEHGGRSPSESHVLVLADLPDLARPSTWTDPFEATMALVRLAEVARMVFPGEETIAQAGPSRVLVVAGRGDLLARRVGLLRDLVDDQTRDRGRARVWWEGLPPGIDLAAALLDEVARG